MKPDPRLMNGRASPQQPASELVALIPALRAFARSFHRSPYDADDLVQETLTKALAKIEQFEPGTSLKSWLFTIMRNTFYTQAKLARREAPGATECASGRLQIDPTQEWSARGHELYAAIQRMPEQQREILILIGVLGMSYDEAADICGCALGTIKSRLSRARLRLLDELGESSVASCIERTDIFPTASLPKPVRN